MKAHPAMARRYVMFACAALTLSLMPIPVLSQPPGTVQSQSPTVFVKPKAFDGVLVNPGIGFTTFQRFNGDALNEGEKWTEGFPIQYQPYGGTLVNKDYPETSIAYFRVYWRFAEPEKGVYNWAMIDKALRTAHARHQTLMLRIAPYGSNTESDVPAWYRKETGEALHKVRSPSTGHSIWARPANSGPSWRPYDGQWMVDPENPDYAREFGALVRALGARYDGDPDLDLIDISIVGPWGEGAGSDLLTKKTHRALLDSYLDSFHKTPLVVQLGDQEGARYAMTKARGAPGTIAGDPQAASLGRESPRVGWRADCLGDMGGFSKTWNHMTDFYPESIVEDGLSNAWKAAPVSMEACWVMQGWEDRGWNIRYIMAQAIKWHVSSFNAKSSAVPKDLWPEVNNWLKHMGYRLALRRFTYPAIIGPDRKLAFTSWWENQGDAPCYRKYAFAVRLSNDRNTAVILTGADIRTWMPGDNLYNNSAFIPASLSDGEYTLSVAIVDPATRRPKVKLAIQGLAPDGWYPLGKIQVHQMLSVSSAGSASVSGSSVRPKL